ncbi:putative chromate transport protein [Oxobacter pfennigii]|uniref:Putative chromate transport protein n=1 Tax=Oxobacter pfennigii TaxID=36849 RepID=A0A0P8W4V4_9CLOT|nr:chromate transporter [Oxobacter pfennigii]KPU42569.1 putative chromate transport protein [Oxobacter pfennigii]
MKHDAKFYWKLFIYTFQLSAFTFGGGYVIVPLMKKRFVDKLGWINEKEMLDFTAIAQSSPGAIAVNASVLLGYHLSGIPGALVAIFGTVLPPLILLSVISIGYSAFIKNQVVKNVLLGMQAGVCAVIIDVVTDMGRSIIKDKRIMPVILMIAAFTAGAIFNVNVVLIILICGLAGFLSVIKSSGKDVTNDIS